VIIFFHAALIQSEDLLLELDAAKHGAGNAERNSVASIQIK
jgi:hypothetical protein